MKCLKVINATSTFFDARKVYTEKLKAFLLTLVNLDETISNKLAGLELKKVTDLSTDAEFEATATLVAEDKGKRAYSISFKDIAPPTQTVIEVLINLEVITFGDSKAFGISAFNAQVQRFKYGCSVASVTCPAHANKESVPILEKEVVLKAIQNLIDKTFVPFNTELGIRD